MKKLTIQKMDLQSVPITKINPAPYNPRVDLKPDDPRFRRLVSSIDTFGNVQPLVWNRRTGHLVGGHQRLKVLSARGDTHAACVVVDLPWAKEKALNVALNKVSGDWDSDKLASLLQEIVTGSDLDLGLTGLRLDEQPLPRPGAGADGGAPLPRLVRPSVGEGERQPRLRRLQRASRTLPLRLETRGTPGLLRRQGREHALAGAPRPHPGYRHPTQKPVELFERAIRNSSKAGDAVYDPFLGSGTSLIASARLGRRCVGLELEQRFCDTIARRYIALAGETAVTPAIAKRYRLSAPPKPKPAPRKAVGA